ncbi:MAG: hypothetical protein JNL57_11385 [Bacteroidetes bacterium]|nr:hypothetical protein [Bacteroidota bacterium]
MSAQVHSANFKDRINQELHRIAVKITNAAREGKISCYKSDSLLNPISKEEALKTGAQLIIKQFQSWRNPDDPTDIYDSAWFELFPAEKVLSNLSCSYAVGPGLDVSLKLKALAPIYNYRIGGFGMNIPLLWVSASDLEKILSPAEWQFVQSFSWFRAFEPAVFYSGTKAAESMSVLWYDVANNHKVTLGDTLAVSQLGQFLAGEFRYRLFNLFWAGQLKIFENGKAVGQDTFFMRHRVGIQTMISDWKFADNPDKLIDTVYYDLPRSFDSFSIAVTPAVAEIRFYQFRQHEAKKDPVMYTCPLNDARPWFNPAGWGIIEALLKLKEN